MPSWFGWMLLLWSVGDLLLIFIRGLHNDTRSEIAGTGIGIALQTLLTVGIWIWIING